MDILQLPEIDDWLGQFEFPDRYLAEYVIKKLRYVGFEELERWIQSELESLVSEIEKGSGRKEAIAIFPIAKPFIHAFNEDKEVKSPSDSGGRIAHSLKNLERRLPSHIELSPRVESMRARRVRHVIFVDDYIGTGDRIVKSWRKEVSRSVKAWHSRGWVKIWIVAFAAHESGLRHVVNSIRAVSRDRVRVNILIKESFINKNTSLRLMACKYGLDIAGNKLWKGYGGLLSPMVFQHGCPNNAPAILWKSCKRGNRPWNALFPNRSVSHELYPLFGSDLTCETTPEELWMAGHYNLALEFIDRYEDYKGRHQLLLFLGYLAKNKSVDKIRMVLVLSDAECRELIGELNKYGLVDDSLVVTEFGKEVLKRGAKQKAQNAQHDEGGVNYYPATFLGFQREI